jgi:hypothetical protein
MVFFFFGMNDYLNDNKLVNVLSVQKKKKEGLISSKWLEFQLRNVCKWYYGALLRRLCFSVLTRMIHNSKAKF